MKIVLCPDVFKSSSNIREFYRTIVDPDAASYMTFSPQKWEHAQIQTITSEMKEKA